MTKPQITEGFMQTFDRIRSIITNECLLMDIDFELINKDCQFTEYEFKQSKSFSYCVYTGVAIAIKCQYLKNGLGDHNVQKNTINQTKAEQMVESISEWLANGAQGADLNDEECFGTV